MDVELAPSTVDLDHLYAKKEEVQLDNNVSLASVDEGIIDDDDLLSFLLGSDFSDQSTPSPGSASSSSDSAYLTPSPGIDDLDLDVDINSDMLSSSAPPSAGNSCGNNFDIDFDWSSNFDLPVFENPATVELSNIESTCTEPPPQLSAITVSKPVKVAPQLSTTFKCKGTTLVLTEEEKRLLEAERVTLPTDMPLTKAEERVLKKVRRKIKNKQSAQESRRKKKDYMDGLERRVQVCTELNQNLQRKVNTLEEQNRSLLDQLKQLQALVATSQPSKAQAGTCLMVLVLAFGLVLFPFGGMNSDGQKSAVNSYTPVMVRSRTLLQVHEDYGVDEPVDSASLVLNNSDYLKAVHQVTIDTATKGQPGALGHIGVAVGGGDGLSSEDRIPDQPIKTAKR